MSARLLFRAKGASFKKARTSWRAYWQRRNEILDEFVKLDAKTLNLLILDKHPNGILIIRTDGQCRMRSWKTIRKMQTDGKLAKELDLRSRANAEGNLLLGFGEGDLPLIVPLTNLHDHGVVVGATKTGKTEFLANIAGQYATLGGPMVVLDAHGDYGRKLISALPKNRLKDVVIIDPAQPGRTWGINLLQVARQLRMGKSLREGDGGRSLEDGIAEAGVDQIVNLEDDKNGITVGSRIGSQVRNILGLVASRDDTTYLDAYMVDTDATIRDLALEECSSPLVRNFFDEQFTKNRADFNDPTRNKLEVFTRHPLIDLFCRRDSCTSLLDLIRANKIVIFNLDQRHFTRGIVNTAGALILRHLLMTLDSQPYPTTGPNRVGIFCDEFGSFASAVAVNFLAEARKRGAFMVLGFQHLNQLGPEIQASLGNAANWTVFRCGAEDGDFIARQFGLRDEHGRVQIGALTEQPTHQAQHYHLAEGDDGRLAPGVVTIQTLPIPTPTYDLDKTVQGILTDGMRAHGKPYNASDEKSAYAQDDLKQDDLLLGVFAAQVSHLPVTGGRADAAGIRKACRVMGHETTDAAVLRKLGVAVARKTVTQRSVELRQVFGLTETGTDEVRSLIDPGVNPTEGGTEHRRGVRGLYVALQCIGPVRVAAPRQDGNQARPDLEVTDALGALAPAWLRAWTRKERVWFQFEHATLTRHYDKILGNVQAAHRAGAEAVVVIRAGPAMEQWSHEAASVHDAVMRAWSGIGRAPRPGIPPDSFTTFGQPFHVCLLAPGPQLLEYDPLTHRLLPLGRDAAPATDANGPARHELTQGRGTAASGNPTSAQALVAAIDEELSRARSESITRASLLAAITRRGLEAPSAEALDALMLSRYDMQATRLGDAWYYD